MEIKNINNLELYSLNQFVYYVAPSVQKNKEVNEYIPALYRNGEELIQGVESIKLLAGVDLNYDGVPNHYVPFGEVSEEQAQYIQSVLLEMNVRSIEKIDSKKHIRKTFSQVIKLRD